MWEFLLYLLIMLSGDSKVLPVVTCETAYALVVGVDDRGDVIPMDAAVPLQLSLVLIEQVVPVLS